MAYSGGAAYVSVLPSLKGFNTSVKTQLTQQLGGVGDMIGRQLGGHISDSLAPGLADVRDEIDKTARDGSKSMTTLARGTAPVLDQLARVSPILGRVRDGFASAVVAGLPMSGMAGTVGGALRTVVDRSDEVATGFGRMAARAETQFSRVGGAIGRGITAPLRSAGQTLDAFGLNAQTAFVLAGVGAAAAGVKFNASQESAVMAFTTMLQSGERAQAFMAQLTDFAARTPFELPGVTSAAQRLMAFGFAAEDVLPTLTAIGDAVSGLGGSAEAVDRVTNAIGQMSAKGKVQSDELLQLTEAGIPALRILANQFGLTSAEMQDMISKGLVSSADAIPKLLQGIENGTKGAAGTTTAFAGMMAQQATTINGVWSNFVDNFNRAMGNLMEPAMPAIKSGLTWLTGQLGLLPGWFATVRAEASPILTQLGHVASDVGRFIMQGVVPALGQVWSAARPVVLIVGGALLAALRAAGHLLSEVVGPALVAVTGWLRPIMPVVVGIAAAFGAWFAIGLAVSAVTKGFALLKGAILTVRIAWLLLSSAFVVSPIGMVVALLAGLVAGVIYAWTQFEGFRNVVLNVWSAIQDAASFAYNNVIRPAFDRIVAALRFVGGVFSWLGSNVVAPVFRAVYSIVAVTASVIATVLVAPVVLGFRLLATVIGWWWNNITLPVFRAVASVLTWLWQTVWQPVFSAIAGVVTWWWNNVTMPVFNAVVWAVRGLGAVALWLWRNAILPAWSAIGSIVSGLWSSVLSPTFSAIGSAVGAVGRAFSVVYASVVRPVWTALGSAVRAVYDNVLAPAFNAIKSAVSAVGDAFSAVVGAIRKVWDSIKGIVAAPINFVIETIWNNGIRAVWNKITGWIPGLDLELGKLAPIRFAQGGVLPGYAPGRDSVHALLSPGEAVLVPELVRILGPANILAANREARRGRGGSGTGPTVGPDGSPRFFLGGIWEGIKSVGRGIANVADAVAGAVVDAASFIANFTSDPLGTLTSMVPGIDGLRTWASKGWGKAITQLPGSMFGGLISSIKRALGFEDDGQGGPPPEKTPLQKMTDFANAQRGKTYLWGATGPEHWDCSGLVGALWAIKQGKDPYRRYMTTATMGVGKYGMKAGKGPFTVYLGPGHTAANVNGLHAEAYNGDGTPLAIGRVGTALSYYDTVMHYARGGLVRSASGRRESFRERGWPEPPNLSVSALRRLVAERPTLYDTGGWLPPGLSTTYNGTRAPEAVLTASQWDAVSAAAHSDGGTFTGTLRLDSGELLGVVRGEIERANDATGRAIARRTRI